MFQSKTWVYTTKGMLDKISNLKRRISDDFFIICAKWHQYDMCVYGHRYIHIWVLQNLARNINWCIFELPVQHPLQCYKTLRMTPSGNKYVSYNIILEHQIWCHFEMIDYVINSLLHWTNLSLFWGNCCSSQHCNLIKCRLS